ncbi:DUF4861 domain-containing protein [Polaribacter sp. MSW13]|uniref:DUF4861 domain-containing protein n=1 Tax=Polaribacter marinus TaxID=2916838 RepID=A0A9X1VRQ2_9FLAO|nr:DUF4861 family protein [Polaribacter marinus]MCI2229822.1 DUF4861 domain-containing protein [Polaribacter marinus]
MNTIKILSYLVIVSFLFSCSQDKKTTIITVKNTLNFERTSEVVEINKTTLHTKNISSNIGIKNIETGELQITQLVDLDGDGTMDQLLFQPKIAGNSEVKFELVNITDAEKPKAEELCYSRFVPERTDDYTWENNKVAFRVYGPVAQKMIEDNVPGGTLSSGVDAWLKRVEYPIINKWYKKYTEKTGTYHEDTGEGLDNFHVGKSRGVGGIAVKVDDTYYFSKNYTKWRTITTGPLRTSFYLEYESWNAAGNKITESKTISLDLGNNLSKFATNIKGTNTISAGLTLHEKDGQVTGNNKSGWVSYWEPHADSEIGTAIIADKNTFNGFEKYDVEAADLSNAYAHLNVINNKVIYYAGFAWKKSKQFETKQAWINYLNTFSKQINHPLAISVK